MARRKAQHRSRVPAAVLIRGHGGTDKTTTAQRLAAALSGEICTGRMPLGTPLRETSLARTYSVSRHIIREALRLLVSQGLAEYASFKGVRVSTMSADDIRDIYQARGLIEVGALSLATRDAIVKLAQIHGRYHDAVLDRNWDLAFAVDVEFHAQIVDLAKSRSLSSVHRDFFRRLQLAHLVSPDFRESASVKSVAEHAEIIVAMQADNLTRASEALARHLRNSERALAGVIQATQIPTKGKKPPPHVFAGAQKRARQMTTGRQA